MPEINRYRYRNGIFKCLEVGPCTLSELESATQLDAEFINDCLSDMVDLGTVEISGDYRITERDMCNVWRVS